MPDSTAPLYVTLGVAEDATHEMIVQAYHQLLADYDSDVIALLRVSSREKRRIIKEAAVALPEIHYAFSRLGDPEQRRIYDSFIESARAAMRIAEPWRHH